MLWPSLWDTSFPMLLRRVLQVPWHQLLTSQLDEATKLVGATISCSGVKLNASHPTYYQPHVQVGCSAGLLGGGGGCGGQGYSVGSGQLVWLVSTGGWGCVRSPVLQAGVGSCCGDGEDVRWGRFVRGDGG